MPIVRSINLDFKVRDKHPKPFKSEVRYFIDIKIVEKVKKESCGLGSSHQVKSV